jgi:hypothetical protein
VLSNEHSLYASSNIASFAISLLSKLADSAYAATLGKDAKKLDPKQVVRECLSAITLIGASAAEMAQKRRNNIRKLCADDFQSLCGPAPGTPAAKKKSTNKGTEFLLGDDLKSASKEAKRSADICKQSGSSSSASPYTDSNQKSQGFRRGGKPSWKNRNDNRQKNQYDGYNKQQFPNNNYNNNQQLNSKFPQKQDHGKKPYWKQQHRN